MPNSGGFKACGHSSTHSQRCRACKSGGAVSTIWPGQLPPDQTQPRFALTGGAELSKWDTLRVEPVVFPQLSEHNYTGLYEGVSGLAKYVTTDKRLVGITIAGPKGAPGAGGYVPGALDTAQRQVISQASVSMEVDEVPVAVAQVRTTVESLGGFVGQLSSSGGPERQQSTMTIRVPQAEFFTALEHIKSLGKVRSENVGSEDVTERFIDLEARLRSALREEESLLSLLDKANQVSEILTIERELSRVRSDIERAQGQLNFLERRVDLSTITVSLFPPDAEVAEPPSGSLTIEVSDVSRSVEGIKALVSGVGGELDRVFVAVRDGKESSDVTLRVFSKDFKQVLSSVEAHGKVRYKEIRETTVPVEAEATPPAKPDARIDISFVEKASSVVWRIIAIAAPVGGVALVALLGLLFYAAYRAGRHRGSLT